MPRRSRCCSETERSKRIRLDFFDNEPCCMCLEDMKFEEDVQIFPCGHAVHDACFDEFMSKTSFTWEPAIKHDGRSQFVICVAADVPCPLCRQKITMAGSEEEPEAHVQLLLLLQTMGCTFNLGQMLCFFRIMKDGSRAGPFIERLLQHDDALELVVAIVQSGEGRQGTAENPLILD